MRKLRGSGAARAVLLRLHRELSAAFCGWRAAAGRRGAVSERVRLFAMRLAAWRAAGARARPGAPSGAGFEAFTHDAVTAERKRAVA